jgi:hypothetical protein
MESLDLPKEDMEKICHRNAEDLFFAPRTGAKTGWTKWPTK